MGKKKNREKQQYIDCIRFIAEGMDEINNLERVYSYAQELMWKEGTYSRGTPETKGQTGGIC